MKHTSKWRLLILSFIFSIGFGLGLQVSINAQADSVPQSVDVKKAASSDMNYSYSKGYRTTGSSGIGVHFIDTIRDSSNNVLFCVQWSKNAPSNTRIAAKVQAQPAVTWLLNDYAKGASGRYRTLGKGDEGDYWLYQAVIHWITESSDTDGGNGYNIQHYMNNSVAVAPSVKTKLQDLYDEANKQAKAGTTEEVLNTRAMSFDPTKLAMNSGDLSGGSYTKSFIFKSTNMKNVKVWLDGEPTGTKLNGSGVDLNSVNNNAKISVSMPYKDVTTVSKTFHVKAKGDWSKQMKVAYIYGDTKDTNQNIAKQVVKATTVPLDVTANMDVSVAPALGKITFTKKGSANNNSQVLAGTKFKLTGGSVVQEVTADKDGKVDFNSLPIGLTYKIEEITQPNKYYTGDLSSYKTTVTALTGSNPSLSATAFGGTLVDKTTHHDVTVKKINAKSAPVAGAQFIIIQTAKGAGLKVNSISEAKTKAMHQSGDYIVAGDNAGKPATVTTDTNGNAVFKLVQTDPNKYDYYTVEVKAPTGYQLALESNKLAITDTGNTNMSFTIQDNLKTPLPVTGSRQMLYYFWGSVTLLLVLTLAVTYRLSYKKL